MMKADSRLNTKRNEDGLTLVEMVVAIVVFAIIALSAYPLFFKSVELVSLNNLTTSATVKVNDILENIRQNPSCADLEALAEGSNEFEDKRGFKYRIDFSLPSGCNEAENVPFEITATRASDSRLLFNQSAEVLVPPRNGYFEL